jgi:hypothetical protein
MAPVAELITLRWRCSRRPGVWTSVHRALSLPVLAFGERRRFTASAGGQEVRGVSIGRRRRVASVLEHLVDEVDPVEQEASTDGWAPDPLEREGFDLVAAEVHRWAANRFRRAGYWIVPEWVDWGAQTSSFPPRRRSKSLRGDLSRVRRAGYELEVIERPARAVWRTFVEEIAIPSALARFGSDAWIPSSAYLRSLGSRITLLFVRRGGERVAGVGVVPVHGRVWMAMLGVRGLAERAGGGATGAAIYALIFAWARNEGYASIDAGRTRPSLADGLARFKAKFGFVPRQDALSPLLAVKIDPAHTGLARRLSTSRLLFHDGSGLAELGSARVADGERDRSPRGLPSSRPAG